MTEYYLKFFESGGSYARLVQEVGHSKAGSVMYRLRREEWVYRDGGRYFLTDAGRSAWDRYLGVRRW